MDFFPILRLLDMGRHPVKRVLLYSRRCIMHPPEVLASTHSGARAMRKLLYTMLLNC